MKSKKFPLKTILKIKEYNEQKELLELAHVSKDFNAITNEIIQISDREKALGNRLKDETDFNVIKEIHETIGLFEEKKKFLMAEREKMRPTIEKAKEKYNIAYKEAESLRILESIHQKREKQEIFKKRFEEIQERMLCQK